MQHNSDNSEHPRLSIVVPMHNEADSISNLLAAVGAAFQKFQGGWELIAVDDGSDDATWAALKDAVSSDSRLHALRLAGRFGQHPATIAGLEAARGAVLAVMDADMQINPEDMRRAVLKVLDGAQLVFAERDHSEEGFLRGTIGAYLSRFFARHGLRPVEKPPSTFFAADAALVERALSTKSARPVTPYHMLLAGPEEIAWIEARNTPRSAGRSSYSPLRLLRLALDVFFGYTDLPAPSVVAAAIAGPLLALLCWSLGALCAVIGWNVVSMLLVLSGAAWALVCFAVLCFLAGHLALRCAVSGPLFVVAESLL
jgi:hypothetical protein